MFRVSPIFFRATFQVMKWQTLYLAVLCLNVAKIPAMSWANDIVASLAVGDVVPGKMKGLVLTLGQTLPSPKN